MSGAALASEPRAVPRIPSITMSCDEMPTEACLNRSWSDLLTAFGQGPLQAPPGGRAYRLVWLRSFHAPVAVRIEVSASGATVLTTRWLHRARDGYALMPSQPAPQTLSAEELRYFEDALKQGGFDRVVADATAAPEPDQVTCTEGAEWVIEAVVAGRYRSVAGGCRTDRDPVVVLGAIFIKLARRRTPNAEFGPVY